MKIAYIILAYKLPEQLTRLVRKLNTDKTSFFIHVDKKTDSETYRKITESLRAYKNVHFLKRYVCNWAGFGVIEATLEGIREVIKSEVWYDYTTLLTGQDYPIKSNSQIQDVLQESNEKSFIEFFPLPDKRWADENGGLDRITHWHFDWFGRRIAFTKKKRLLPHHLNSLWLAFTKAFHLQRKFFEDIDLFAGSAVWCLARDCVEYINEYSQRNKDFVKFFRHVFAPDEIFFQTILANSHLRKSLVDDDLRYIVWTDSPHPEILRKQDFGNFINTDKLFARKFDVTIDAEVLNMIDKYNEEGNSVTAHLPSNT